MELVLLEEPSLRGVVKFSLCSRTDGRVSATLPSKLLFTKHIEASPVPSWQVANFKLTYS